VVLELGHLGNFGAGDGPVLDRDLGVAVGLGKRQAQRAQVDLDVPQRPVAEFGCQRPMGRPYNQRGIYRNQKDGEMTALVPSRSFSAGRNFPIDRVVITRNPPKSGPICPFCLRSH
jgi:hypothetical protein